MIRLINLKNIDEVQQLVEIDQLAFGLENGWTVKNFTSERSFKPRLSFLSENDGEIRGYIVAYRSGVDVAHISRLAIGTTYQNQGIARQLIKELKRKVGKEGFRKLTVEHPRNTSLQAFYLRNGFKKLSDTEIISYVDQMKKNDATAYFGESPQRIVYVMEL